MRLEAQLLLPPRERTPAEALRRMGAVQAQDYPMARLALALRSGEGGGAVEKAFRAGEILRTHVLRPTWHFVAAADIRWMLALSAPRIMGQTRSRDRKLGLDEKTFDKTGLILEAALKNGTHLTKEELARRLEEAGIATDNYRLAHILMRAELEALICSGIPRGKKQTWALLAERAPDAQRYDAKTAAVLLARRYFASRGPATAGDFSWWSGLPGGTARKAADALQEAGDFTARETGGLTLFFPKGLEVRRLPANLVHLLPAFDEYIISYRDRSAVLPEASYSRAVSSNGIFHPVILRAGRAAGTWKRAAGKISLAFFDKNPPPALRRAVEKAASALP
ncbi:MAG: winged helix DNA-binding domain-containing protein [Spirochaetales bacterium]|nr:winged helix DNA-binding domain-containing protein [Spirochaetales bacterium]